MGNDTVLQLSHGGLSATIAPATGGSLAAFSADGREMMRPFDATLPGAAAGDPLAMACFPLVPFSNRIAHGRFVFNGRPVALAPDPIGARHAIHGLGWRRPWTVEAASGREATLVFCHDGGEWPWAFEARQTFTLDGEALTIVLALRNRADEPMPAGLGLHPFFPGRARARLTADLPFVWETGADPLPRARANVPPEWNFARGRALAPLALDHCFSGGAGILRIEWEGQPLALSIERQGSNHAVIYTPRDRDFFCVEPVSHVPDAVNRPEGVDVTGLRVLAPGEEMRLLCRFRVTPV